MEQLLTHPDIFTTYLCAFLSVRDLCCADIALSSNRRLAPLLKTLLLPLEDTGEDKGEEGGAGSLRQRVLSMTEHLLVAEAITEAQLDWLITCGTPLRTITFVPSITDSALVTLSRALSQQQQQQSPHCGTALTALDLAHCRFLSAAGLTSLSRECCSLNSLVADYCQLDDEGVVSFAQASSDGGGLRSLSVRNCHLLTDIAVTALVEICPSLTHLDMSGCRHISDASLKALSQGGSSTLSVLRLSHCTVTDNGIIALAHSCPALTLLDLRYCKQISDASILSVSKTCQAMSDLNLSQCTRITAASVIVLAQKCPSLTRLDLSGCANVTDVSLTALSQASVPLTDLNLSGCCHISDKGLVALAQGCPALTSLDLSCCVNVTDGAVFALLNGCQRLKHLNPRHCSLLSPEGIKACCEISSSFHEYSAVTIQLQMRRCQAKQKTEKLRLYLQQCTQLERDEQFFALEEKVAQAGVAVAAHAVEAGALAITVQRLETRDREYTLRQQQLEQQVKDIRTALQQQEKEANVLIRIKDDEIAALAASLVENRSELESFVVEKSDQTGSLKAANEDLQGEVAELESLMMSSHKDLQESRSIVSNLQTKCAELTASKKNKETDNRRLTTELSELNDILILRLDDLAKASEEALALRLKNEALHASQSEEHSARAKDIDSLRKEVELLEAIRTDTLSKLEEHEEMNEDLSEEVSYLKFNFRKKESELFWKSKEYDTVVVDRDALSAKLLAANKRNNVLESEILSKSKAMNDLATELDTCHDNLKYLISENASLESKNIEANDSFLKALAVGKQCASAKKTSQKLLSDIENERKVQEKNSVPAMGESVSDSSTCTAAESSSLLFPISSRATATPKQREQEEVCVRQSRVLGSTEAEGKEEEEEEDGDENEEEGWGKKKEMGEGADGPPAPSPIEPIHPGEVIKSSSKLKDQYLKHLVLKNKDVPAHVPVVSKLWPTSPKGTSTSSPSTFKKIYDSTAPVTAAKTLDEMNSRKHSRSKTGEEGGGGGRRRKHLEQPQSSPERWPPLVTALRPPPSNDVDLHEPDMSVHSCCNSIATRTGMAPDSDGEEEKEKEEEGQWSFSLKSSPMEVQVQVEVQEVEEEDSGSDESAPPPPPTLSSPSSVPPMSFSFSTSTSPPYSVFSRSSSNSSSNTCKKSSCSASYSRATSSQRLRVLGNVETKVNKLYFLYPCTHNVCLIDIYQFQDHFKEDHLHDYVFNRGGEPGHSSHNGSPSCARSPSQAIKHKFLNTQRGVAAMSNNNNDKATPPNSLSRGGDNSLATKIYKNSSKGVSHVLGREGGSSSSSSPPKSLAKLLSSQTPPRNNIF